MQIIGPSTLGRLEQTKQANRRFSLLVQFTLNISFQMSQIVHSERPKQKNCEFIDKLVDMLEKYSGLVHWDQNGDQLIISRKDEVERSVLPEYFRHQNFASFVRQLNMYGFCKKEKSQEFLRFTHKIFKKGNESQFHLIQRKAKVRNIKNSSSKFFESHNKLIETIKTKSGLNDEAQELTVSLLQFKENTQDATRRIKFQLDKLFLQFKDIRSKSVLETIEYIKKQSYASIVSSLIKAKQIDELLNQQLNTSKELTGRLSEGEQSECSLEHELGNLESQSCSDDNMCQRFELEEDEMSAFNQFNRKQ